MCFRYRVGVALTFSLLLGATLACSKLEPPPPRRATQRATAANTGATIPAAWPQSSTLSPITAEQLLARARASGKKGTLVNAWASWCGPCREELPMLTSLAKNLAAQSIDVVLVSVDEPEDRAKAEAFLRSLDIKLPAYLAARPLGDFKAGLNPRWPGMLPASFLFDKNGRAALLLGRRSVRERNRDRHRRISRGQTDRR